MVGGQTPPPQAIEKDRNPERLDQGTELLLAVAPVETRSSHYRRALSRGKQCSGLLYASGRCASPEPDKAGTSDSASVKTTSSG